MQWLVSYAILCGALGIFLTEAVPVSARELRLARSPTYRIFGGEEATGNRDYVVTFRLYERGKWHNYCGGSLVSPEWVLTAAHCVDPKFLKDDELWIGGLDENQLGQFERKKAARWVCHSKFDPSLGMDNDICLVKLASSSSRSVIKINDSPATEEPGTSATVTGFGRVMGDEGARQTEKLMMADAPVLSDQACKKVYGNKFNAKNMLCAGQEDGSQDACNGDSGSAMVADNGLQVGIVSWGSGCGNPGLYTVYVRVSAYANWIAKTTGTAVVGSDAGRGEDEAVLDEAEDPPETETGSSSSKTQTSTSKQPGKSTSSEGDTSTSTSMVTTDAEYSDVDEPVGLDTMGDEATAVDSPPIADGSGSSPTQAADVICTGDEGTTGNSTKCALDNSNDISPDIDGDNGTDTWTTDGGAAYATGEVDSLLQMPTFTPAPTATVEDPHKVDTDDGNHADGIGAVNVEMLSDMFMAMPNAMSAEREAPADTEAAAATMWAMAAGTTAADGNELAVTAEAGDWEQLSEGMLGEADEALVYDSPQSGYYGDYVGSDVQVGMEGSDIVKLPVEDDDSDSGADGVERDSGVLPVADGGDSSFKSNMDTYRHTLPVDQPDICNNSCVLFLGECVHRRGDVVYRVRPVDLVGDDKSDFPMRSPRGGMSLVALYDGPVDTVLRIHKHTDDPMEDGTSINVASEGSGIVDLSTFLDEGQYALDVFSPAGAQGSFLVWVGAQYPADRNTASATDSLTA